MQRAPLDSTRPPARPTGGLPDDERRPAGGVLRGPAPRLLYRGLVRAVAAAVAIPLVAAIPARAAAQTTEGVTVALTVEAMSMSGAGYRTVTGAGIGGELGHSITRHLSVHIGAGVGASSTGLVARAELLTRLGLPIARRAVAYGQIGFASHGREAGNDEQRSGTGLSLGAGGEWLLRPGRSLVIGARHWEGTITEADGSGKGRARATQFLVGIRFRAPDGGRR